MPLLPGSVFLCAGPNSNGCQFFITTAPAPGLDGKNVVCGRLLNTESIVVLSMLEQVPTDKDDKPTILCTVVDSGEL